VLKQQSLFFGLFAVTLVACQSASPTPTQAPASFPFIPRVLATPLPGVQPPAVKGKFVFAPGDGSLMAQDANAKDAQMIFDPKDGTYADFPAFSPDGKQLAFSTSSIKPDGTFQYDIRLANPDGSNSRILAVPDKPKGMFAHPAWSPDGKSVIFTQSYPEGTGEHSEIDRTSSSSGTVERVIDNALDGEVSPDGKWMAFYKFDAQSFALSLWIAKPDGSGAKTLLDTQAFSALQSARFSPDSQWVLFAASGPPKKKLPGVAQLNIHDNDACAISFLSACLVERAYAHGLPWDLWTVNLDGSKFNQVTQLGADSPYSAWSADGKLIALYDSSGIYIIDREKKSVFPISNKGGYGAFDWK
jgi:Tol biopolymer transport system component